MATHDFLPVTFHNTFGSHAPALRVDPGDSISTSTVDARGRDLNNAELAGRPNPQTGPIYVNGAEAGDTLVFQLEHLRPNRSLGWTSAQLAPNVLDLWNSFTTPSRPFTHTLRFIRILPSPSFSPFSGVE